MELLTGQADLNEYPEPLKIQKKDPFFDSPETKLLRIDQDPVTNHWKYPQLFMSDKLGSLHMYEIGFDNRNLIYRSGHVKTENWVITTDEIIPKSTRTVQEQAQLEARKRYKDKMIQDGYRPYFEQLSENIEQEGANHYLKKEEKEKEIIERKKQGKKPQSTYVAIDRWPVAVLAKLDGYRMRVSQGPSGKLIKTSRGNEEWYWISHLDQELKDFMDYLPPGSKLEGELYLHNMVFGNLGSIVMSKKTLHPLLDTLEYYIFDIYIPETPYEVRYNILIDSYLKYLEDGYVNKKVFILSATLAYNEDDITEYHDYFYHLGYEGAIIHKLAGSNPTPKNLKESYYKPGKSNNMLKVKNFSDSEAIVIDIEESHGNQKGLAVLVVRGIRDEFKDRIFKLGPGEDFERRREWFLRPKDIIGKVVTYKYFGTSMSDGLPRHPVFKAIRESIDLPKP